MKKAFSSVLIFILALAIPLSAQEDRLTKAKKANSPKFTEIPEQIEKMCDSFFGQVIEKKYPEAYKELLKNSPIFKNEGEVKNLIKETRRAFSTYGDMHGYEPVSAEAVTDSYIRARYLSIHTDLPMRWIFTFYKSPKRGWMVSNIRFDDLTEYFFSDE